MIDSRLAEVKIEASTMPPVPVRRGFLGKKAVCVKLPFYKCWLIARKKIENEKTNWSS